MATTRSYTVMVS